MIESRQWSFVADMDSSGAVTINDIWLWFEWLCFYPGDMIVKYFVNNESKVSQYLEFTNNDYGGIFSGAVSCVAWAIVITFLINEIKLHKS